MQRSQRVCARRPFNLFRMIERAPFGATGHESSRVIFGAAALGDVSKADADRTLELLLEHGINHIDVAASYGDAELRIAPWLTRARVLPRHQDRRAHLRRGARADPPLARPARRRPRRLDPAPQPRRRDRVGHRAGRRRRAGGAASRRATRAWCASSASPATGSRCRRCTSAASSASTSTPCCARTTTSRCRTTRYARDVRGARRAVRRARRRAADDQEPRPRAVGGPRADRVDLVRAADRAGRHRPGRRTGCSATRRSSCSPPATSTCCRSCSTRPSRFTERPPTTRRWARCSSPRCSPSGYGVVVDSVNVSVLRVASRCAARRWRRRAAGSRSSPRRC